MITYQHGAHTGVDHYTTAKVDLFYSVLHKSNIRRVVGAIGFEPTTYGSQNRRATRLRYAPLTAS